MSGQPPPNDPKTAQLREHVQFVAQALVDLDAVVATLNDPEWRDPFLVSIEAGRAVVALHQETVRLSVADDFATLRSQFARHHVPREDPVLGQSENLTRIRSARGGLLADIEELLAQAAVLGLRPTDLSNQLPAAIEFERAGLEGLFDGLTRRLAIVEDGLKLIEKEGLPDAAPNVRQFGLINFFVNSMSVELALAKIEASAKTIIDFNSLGRAVEVMAELTRDFAASVNGMRRTVSDGLRAATRAFVPKVRRLSSGVRAIVGRVVKPKVGSAFKAPTLATQIWSHDEVWALIAEGDTAVAEGSLVLARRAYDAANSQAQEANLAAPLDINWLHDLSVIHSRLGNVEKLVGDLPAARLNYELSLNITERLASRDLDNGNLQRSLAVGYNKLGDVDLMAGDLRSARKSYQEGLKIVQRLITEMPDVQDWSRDLAIAHERIGDVDLEISDLSAARQHFEISLEIAEQLAAEDIENWELKRDLSVTYGKFGILEKEAENFSAARPHFEASFVIRQQLAKQDPQNAELQRDLSVAYQRLGDIEAAQGNLIAAQPHFEAGLAIAERLSKLEPSNVGWQRDLVVSYAKLALLVEMAGNNLVAINLFESAERILMTLLTKSPDQPRLIRDLANVQHDLERLRRKSAI
jgi:tetratricopeptide (TPR) repeat protein